MRWGKWDIDFFFSFKVCEQNRYTWERVDVARNVHIIISISGIFLFPLQDECMELRARLTCGSNSWIE